MGASKKAVLSALANLSIQYNFAVIAIALAFMDNTASDPVAVPAAYPRTDVQSALLKSLVFAGAITGQLTMGYAGDALGRRKAMLLTNCFSICGALGSAVFTWGPNIYTIMAVCRFLLGVGVGGKYPLAATISQEGDDGASNRSFEVAKAFFWQTPGALLPYLVAMLLMAIVGKEHHGADFMTATSFQFRFLLGFGALPTMVTTVLTYQSTESAEYEAIRGQQRSVHSNPLSVAARHPELWAPLAGCGLAWFLYDFAYYGTSFNQVTITDEVFGNGDMLWDSCWQNVVLCSVGLPGVVAAVSMLLCWSSRKLQLWGFVFSIVSCCTLAAAVHFQASSTIKFACFCFVLLILNWGVNVSTYTLPAECFPCEVRSTFFGLSAAMGKVGALVGSACFKSITDAVGLDGVYLVCAGFGALGILVTWLLIPSGRSSQLSARSIGSDALERLEPAAKA